MTLETKDIVAKFLEEHPKQEYYAITYASNDDDSQPTLIYPLNEDELEEFKLRKKELEEEDFSWAEVVSDEETDSLSKYASYIDFFGRYFFIEEVDLENKYYVFKFKVALFDNAQSDPIFKNVRINLTLEEYATLLGWQLEHKDASFNGLNHDYPELYAKISEEAARLCSVDTLLWSYPKETYCIFMDEVKEDAGKMME